jgi:hypothetical protein
MTLILSLATTKRVVQASDRRLTWPDGRVEDQANKAVCVVCADARFSIAYTGLAQLGPGLVGTDEWLVDSLASSRAGELDLRSIIEFLQNQAHVVLENTHVRPELKGLSFVLVGYQRTRPFAVSVSNIEGDNFSILDHIQPTFRANVAQLRADADPRTAQILMVSGAEPAADVFRHRVRKLGRKRFFQTAPSDVVVKELIFLIRSASREPCYGSRVGRNCMSVETTLDSGFLAKYFPEHESPQQYAPHFIFPNISYRDLQVWTGPEPPPWWSK